MNRRFFLGGLAAVACTSTSAPAPSPAKPGLDRIRIGWQTTWATQGQLAVILMRTNILEQHGFEATFHGFSYGGPLNEGALAGAVDVLFTADQPAIALASKADNWGIIGRLMTNRVGTFVPPDSPIQSAADLKGHTVAVPFGAAAHRATLGAIQRAGLKVGSDVRVTNLGLQEIVALVGAGAAEGRWGNTHAAAAWDPAFANLEHAGAVRVIDQADVTSVVVMDDRFSARVGNAGERFQKALHAAYDFFRADPGRANAWFKADSDLPFDVGVLELAASVEPNLKATEPQGIRVHLDEDDLLNMQRAADFMVEAKLLRGSVQLSTLLRPSALRPVVASVTASQVDVVGAD
jgi:sulfonate transport system substrate-binding protein